jgi:hypothetical protein
MTGQFGEKCFHIIYLELSLFNQQQKL